MDFSKSTQAKEWTFSESSLHVIKATRQMNWERTIIENNNNNNSYEKLSVEEEDLLLNVFISMYPKVVNQRWNFTERTWAVAITYLRRFFIYNSVMDYDIKQCLHTCILLASKAEEERKHNNKTFQFMIAEKGTADVDEKSVLALEYVILDALKFHLEVFTPYLPLTGFCIDIQTKLNIEYEQLKEIKSKSEEIINKAITTEVILLFPPSQIALAALRYTIVTHFSLEDIWNRYIVNTFGNADQLGEHWLLLDDSMKKIQNYFFLEIMAADKEKIKMINNKLKGIPKIALL